jgi:hypothetical protein
MPKMRRLFTVGRALGALLAAVAPCRSMAQGWDASLPDLALHDVRIDGRSLEEAWQQLGRRHMVRTVLLVTDPAATRKDVRFSCGRCRAREVLDALVKPFPGYGWASDPATGVIWLRAKGAGTAVLGQRLHLPAPQPGLPMQSGVLAILSRELGLGFALRGMSGVRAANTFDFPVDLPGGSLSLEGLFGTLCRGNPTKTFYLRVAGAEVGVTPVNLVSEEGDAAPEGLRHWWQVEVGGPRGAPVGAAELRRALAAASPKVRAAARGYLEGMAWRTDFDALVRGASSGPEAVWTAVGAASVLVRHPAATHLASLERLEAETRTGGFWRRDADPALRPAAFETLTRLTASPEDWARLAKVLRYDVP